EAGARQALARADTQPAAPPLADGALASDVHVRTNGGPAARAVTVPLAGPRPRDRGTVPFEKARAPSSDLVTAPPSRELPEPASDESGLYVPEPKRGATTPMGPAVAGAPHGQPPRVDTPEPRRPRRGSFMRLLNGVAA